MPQLQRPRDLLPQRYVAHAAGTRQAKSTLSTRFHSRMDVPTRHGYPQAPSSNFNWSVEFIVQRHHIMANHAGTAATTEGHPASERYPEDTSCYAQSNSEYGIWPQVLGGQGRPKPILPRPLPLANALVESPAVAGVTAGDAARSKIPRGHQFPVGRPQGLDGGGLEVIVACPEL